MVQKKQFIVNQHFTTKEKALSLLLFNLAITCKYTHQKKVFSFRGH